MEKICTWVLCARCGTIVYTACTWSIGSFTIFFRDLECRPRPTKDDWHWGKHETHCLKISSLSVIWGYWCNIANNNGCKIRDQPTTMILMVGLSYPLISHETSKDFWPRWSRLLALRRRAARLQAPALSALWHWMSLMAVPTVALALCWRLARNIRKYPGLLVIFTAEVIRDYNL